MEESISRSGTRTDLHRRPRSCPGLLRSPPPHRPRAGPVNPASPADPAPRRDSLSRLACSRRPSAHRGRVPGLLWPSCARPARGQHGLRRYDAAPPPRITRERLTPRRIEARLLTMRSRARLPSSPTAFSLLVLLQQPAPRLLLGHPKPAPASGPWTFLSLEWPSPVSARLLLPVTRDKRRRLRAAPSDPSARRRWPSHHQRTVPTVLCVAFYVPTELSCHFLFVFDFAVSFCRIQKHELGEKRTLVHLVRAVSPAPSTASGVF